MVCLNTFKLKMGASAAPKLLNKNSTIRFTFWIQNHQLLTFQKASKKFLLSYSFVNNNANDNYCQLSLALLFPNFSRSIILPLT